MIEFRNVTKTYDNGAKALKGVSMKIEDGEFVFLVGPSGSGKSTVIKLLTAELPPTTGTVLVNGYDVGKMRRSQVPYMRRTLGVIFQDFRLIEKKTVFENVAFAMRVIGASEQEIKRRVPYLLDKKQPDEAYLKQLTELLGIQGRLDHLPHELSGGQQQRVAIARALIAKPDVIFADEPTGNLDSKSGGEVMELLQGVWKKMGKALVVITHDIRIARMADRQFQIVDGILSEVTAR